MAWTKAAAKRRTEITVASTFALAVALAACGQSGGAESGAQPPPVVGVVEIAAQPHESTVRLAGRVSAFEVSEVRPQIGGIVRSRRFVEGSEVRAGQLLYEIDPGLARTELSGAQAAAASSRAQYERFQQLIGIGAVSRQELDDARAAADQAEAALAAARISAAYTRVTAPISGVIGASSVTSGALATPAQAAPFAVIQQIDKVYVDLTLSAAELMRLRKSFDQQGGARVTLTLPDGSTYARTGQLQFSEVTVSEGTGTVRLRALFPNPERVLLPGMFVKANVSVGVDPDAILAPQQGVTRNAKGEAIALVLTPENVVEQRIVETGATAGDKWVVLSGLSTGDRLIVEGGQRVRPGDAATAAVAGVPAQKSGSAGDLRGREG
ncbi:MAG: efflux RND transporter periplasmic adaptor subunit [Hyphomonadaceae bacterium]|nr:efflux RND transporter periplasmic adaptor subunit [Hyphomonadaceae bacterium]